MSRLTLSAIVLVLVVVSSSLANQFPAKVSDTGGSAAPPATPFSAMTPREVAELHADILMARKEYMEAASAYLRILDGEPTNAALLNKIGVAYQQLGDLDRSERFYKRAMRADKKFASAANNCGTVEYEKKHYGKAIRFYGKALALRGDMPTVYSNLGYAYFADKEYPEAMNSFQKALALDPTIFDRKGLGGTLVQQRSMPDPGLFYFFVAKTYALAGDAERAAHYLKLARDDGYGAFLSAQTDPAFAKVIKDPALQEVLHSPPSYARNSKKVMQN
ncbi:MAG: tetratricopeptide repeat protein [Candidatus Acidiferrales bacterium]